MTGEFADRVVWLVGASGGLGQAMTRAFLNSGATAVVSGRNEAKLRKAVEDHGAVGRAVALAIDITDSASVARTMDAIVARYGRIDVLVNTTSVSVFGDFLELGDEAWRAVYEAKLFAYVRTMRATIPHMLKQSRGAIVNVSGSGGKYPNFPSHIAGSSGNAAVNLATKAVADLYGRHGIRANCIAPGPIRSERLASVASANAALARPMPGQWTVEDASGHARAAGEPEDVAEAALFLASDRSRHINGTVLTVDGGATPTVG